MIGAKLSLKAVSRVAERCGHHARVGDDYIEGVPFRQQFITAGTHTLKVSKIEPDQLECATIVCSVLSHLRSRIFSFGKIPRRTHNMCAMCRQRPRRFHAKSGGGTSYENSFAFRFTLDKTSSVVRSCSK